MMKTKISLILIVLILAVALAACGGSGNGDVANVVYPTVVDATVVFATPITTPSCYWDIHGSLDMSQRDLICTTPTVTPTPVDK